MNSDPQNPSWLARFFLFCSGTNIDVLNQCSKTTIIKRAGLGALVLVPTLLAAFAGYYFLGTIFLGQPYVAFGGGFVWALMVFTFDRFIVSTHRKGWASVLPATGRLCMAFVVAMVVAHPLVLSLFQGTIGEHIYTKGLEKKDQIIAQYDELLAAKEDNIVNLKKEINDKSNAISHGGGQVSPEVQNLRDRIGEQYEALADEIAGKSKRTGKRTYGDVAKTIDRKIKFLENQLQQVITKDKANARQIAENLKLQKDELVALTERNIALVNDKRTEIEQIKQQRDKELKNFDTNAANDFLARSNALEELVTQNPNTQKWLWLLTALFVVVDLLPVIFITFAGTDDYDRKLGTEDILNQHEESIEQNVSIKTKELRERIAIKGVEVGEIKKELVQIVDVAITKLEQLDRFFLSIIQHNLEFRRMVNTYKQNLNGDHEHTQKISEILGEYYPHSNQVVRETLQTLRTLANGSHDRGASL